MLANVKWFKKRKYGGWGITPVTWQGWVYVISIVLIILLANLLCILFQAANLIKILINLVIILLITIDMTTILMKIELDEREQMHESISERNAAWVMVFITVIGISYQSINSILHNSLNIDFFLIFVLIGGILAKAITYYKFKNL